MVPTGTPTLGDRTFRAERRLKYRMRNARLRQSAVVEDLDYRDPRGLDKALMNRLIAGQWIKKRRNLLITRPTGTGKSWIACALGNKPCYDGFTVQYHRLSRLFGELGYASGDGRYPKVMKKTRAFRSPRVGRSGAGETHRAAAARNAGHPQGPPRAPLHARGQSVARRALAQNDRRTHPRPCHPRPACAQWLSHRAEGRINAKINARGAKRLKAKS